MRLRVIDFGFVSALRSQAVYHGIARCMDESDEPVLSLVNPLEPYVCVGQHQEIAREVDEEYCNRWELPIIRREVGGGAVYLDRNQMFFHFVYPSSKLPRAASLLYPMFIDPVVRTYKEIGIEAAYRPINDIQVNGRKIGGTGAAVIDEATVMVGSFMFDFDIETMVHCLKVPSEKFRDKLRSGMRDYMSTMSTELDELPQRAQVKEIFFKHIEESLKVHPEEIKPTTEMLAAIEKEEIRLADPEWTYQVGKKFVEKGVKIAAGTYLTEYAHKAAGGLIRVRLLNRENSIGDLLLTGDFTVLPQNGIDSLAGRLKGTSLDVGSLNRAVAEAIRTLALDIPGVSVEDITATIMGAVHDE